MATEVVRLARRTLIPMRYWLGYVVTFQVVGWVSMVVSGLDWVGSWKMAYDWVAASLVVVGPVAAGATAVTYARIRRSSVGELMRGRALPCGWCAPLLKVWAAVVVSTVMLALAVSGYVRARGVPVAPEQLVNVPYLLTLSLAQVTFGALVGLWLREAWAGAVGVALAFLGFLLAATGLLPKTLVPGGTTGTLVGETYRPMVMLLLCLSASGLAVALLAVLHAHFGGARWAMAVLAVVGVGGLLIGCAPGMDLEGRTRFSEVDYVCRGEGPTLCMARDTPLLAARGAEALHALSRPLVDIGVPLPDRWVQDLYLPGPPDAGEFTLSNRSESTGRLLLSDVIRSLAHPAPCPHEESEPGRSLSARNRLAGWIAVRTDVATVDEEQEGVGPSPRFVAWAHSARSEPWVRSTYRKLRECRLRAIVRPPGLR